MGAGADELDRPEAEPGLEAPRAPDVRLAMPARADNVAVVRQALAGVLDALDVEDAIAADVKIAVSEACTNVVLHAYDGGDGPMEVRIALRGARLVISVRDRGHGVAPLPASPDAPALGYGLALIASLADEFAIRGGRAGAAVEMAFDLPATAAALASATDRPRPVALAPEPGGVAVGVAFGPLVAPVLGRVVAMLAARGDFSIDRLSDAQLISDALAAYARPHGVDGHLRVVLDEHEGGLELRVGPLVAGGARALVRDTELPNLGCVLERLADDVSVVPYDDPVAARGVECLHLQVAGRH